MSSDAAPPPPPEMDEEKELEFNQMAEEPQKQKTKLLEKPVMPTELEIDMLVTKAKTLDAEHLADKCLGYGKNLYKSSQEEEAFVDLNEIRREEILYARDETRRNLIETLRLKIDQESSKRKKRTTSFLGDSESEDENSRNRAGSDASDSEDSQSSFERKVSRKRTKSYDEEQDKADLPIEFKDIKEYMLQVSRKTFLKFIDEPFLKNLSGALVKISSDDTYKIREVKQVCYLDRGKEYAVEKVNNVDFFLKLKPKGKNGSEDNLKFISNQPITEEEFKEYVKESEELGFELPTIQDAELFKTKLMNDIYNHTYTNEEIKSKVERKKARRNYKFQITFYTRDKQEMKRKIAFMQQKPVEEQEEDHDEALLELKERLLKLEASYTEYMDRKLKNERTSVMVNNINEKNMRRNLMEGADYSTETKDNPYARQSCRPQTLWSTRPKQSPKAADTIKDSSDSVADVKVDHDARKAQADRERMDRFKQAAEARKKMEQTHIPDIDIDGKRSASSPTSKKRSLLVPQRFKVQPKKYMSLTEYYKLQEERKNIVKPANPT